VNPGDIIGTYVLDRRLGKGVTASTWLAHLAQDTPSAAAGNERSENGAAESLSDSQPESPPDNPPTSPPVVLKIFDLAETSSWKPLDQFKREAEILRTLNHPRIPKYIESFDLAQGGHFEFVLVMQYIEGETIESHVFSGKKFTEAHIEQMLAELADILAYIGSLRPPIVHRDINPRNLILQPDGHIALVDFSGVQDAIRSALYPGATLVGTAGYIPVEQVSGRATHRSDLYGAAATAVFMLTGRNPAELPMRNLKIDLSGLLYLSPGLAYVLGNWLDPDQDRRFLSAAKAAAILRGEEPVPTAVLASSPSNARSSENTRNVESLQSSRRALISHILSEPDAGRESVDYPAELPSDSKLEIQPLDPGLYIKLPRGKRAASSSGFAFFPIVWLGFVFFLTTMTLRMRAPMFFPLFSIPFWIAGVAMLKSFLKPSITDTELFITPDGLLKKSSSFISNSAQQYAIFDVGTAKVQRSSVQLNNRYLKELAIDAGTGTLTFGLGLSDRELYYLEKRINEELEKLKKLPRE
jgi:serine/threonine protein kinase